MVVVILTVIIIASEGWTLFVKGKFHMQSSLNYLTESTELKPESQYLISSSDFIPAINLLNKNSTGSIFNYYHLS